MRNTALLLAIVLISTPAVAQEDVSSSFDELMRAQRLREGGIVWVISDISGTGSYQEIDARFVDLTDATITVLVEAVPPGATNLATSLAGEGHTLLLREDRVARIDAEVIDSLKNGVATGALVGFAAGTIPALIAWATCDSWCFGFQGAALLGGVVGAGAGAAIGAAMDSRRTTRVVVYATPDSVNTYIAVSVAPVITRERRGFLFNIEW